MKIRANKSSNQNNDYELILSPLQINNIVINYIILAILALIPLIIHIKPLYLVSPNMDPLTYLSTGEIIDFFTYYKFIALMVLSCLVVLLFTYSVFKIKKPTIFRSLSLAIILLLISLMLSVLSSDFKTIALFGNYSRYVGCLTFSALAFIFLVIINTKFLSSQYQGLFYALYPLTVVNFLLAILNYFKIDILNNDFVRLIILGRYQGTIFEGGSFLEGTNGHFNYTSALGAVLFAAFCGKALFAASNKKDRILSSLLAVFSGIIVFASNSLNGIVTLIFIFVVIAGITIDSRDKAQIRCFIVICGVLVIFSIILSLYNDFLLKDIFNNMLIICATVILSFVVLLSYFGVKYRHIIGQKKLIVTTIVLIIALILLIVGIKDPLNNRLQQEKIKMDSESIRQTLMTNEFDIPEKGWTMGTGRFYIWKETLELVKKKPLFGHGLDTLAYTFDQTDPAKISSLSEADVVVDKPHNTYLYILYGSGVIGLLAYLTIIVQVIIKAVKMTINRSSNYNLQWPLLMAILAYLYQAFFNDPVIGSEVIFWIILGYSYLLSSSHLKLNSKSS